MEFLLELDKKVFLFFNSLHHPTLDPIMYFITHTWAWVPLYVFLLYLLIKSYGKESWKPLLGIVLVIVVGDQLISTFMKPFFGRLRPSHDPAMEGLVHLVNSGKGLYRGGKFSFASGHAANTFSTATFFFLLLRGTKPYIWLLFVWAALMTYTRLYLGVHYPGDILVGGSIGAFLGWAGFKITRKFLYRRSSPSKT